ncbi:phage tail sheath family protein [Xenorhabdus bovienii]|uniref:phage tail sheath family protein n=1 Tax=Xenorhabdus bovienii TaxID=40576 RepID=UPI00237C5DDE|nr:phage tail sheath C-terminal domain-containing protein [Xenorhabdus bovienii]MDE1482857.1 phage tail sheath family protein [Xenorhabdus bovienii]MDE9431729.1 phage tail sheath family protein [Xenorhabdus bovienii]MDE9441812.1 phage tail sheath family protein [Xenorhabdus bovienii]MDE9489454.1 phage tail sheath family protein [Xenorhabdus bovienii]MDE9505855.1 phage tail sheath family protein [Xenorhabdus bovienii]
MEMTQPGITITEHLISQWSNNAFIGTPIFIGYTQSPTDENTHNNTVIKLTSLTDFPLSFSKTVLMYYSVCHFFENGGQQAYMLSLGQEPKKGKGRSLIAELQQDWLKHAITAESEITLIIVPDIARFNQLGNVDSWLQFWQSVLNLCKSRRGIMALLDAPDQPKLAAQCLMKFSSKDRPWGAVYWPRVNSSYQEHNRPVVLSPTAAVAAIIQRYDNEQGVWTAPANVSLAKAISPLCSHIKADGLFNQDGTSLNLVRSFPGKGIRIWGCRTLENIPDSPWRYIQTRRLVSYIEAHLTQLGRAFVFEPNNAITWMKLKGQSHNWLRQLWLKGGLRGIQEEHAFEVLLGVHESMNEDELREGKMIMKIRLALLIPAEFIELSLVFDTRTGMLD